MCICNPSTSMVTWELDTRESFGNSPASYPGLHRAAVSMVEGESCPLTATHSVHKPLYANIKNK